MKRFRVFRQSGPVDCGPNCLQMVANFYGKPYPLDQLKELIGMSWVGTSLHNISQAANKIGFKTLTVETSFEQLDDEIRLPCIAYWNQKHFVVIPPQNYSRKNPKNKIRVADPALGMVKVAKEAFMEAWANPDTQNGIVLVLEPTASFHLRDPQNIGLK